MKDYAVAQMLHPKLCKPLYDVAVRDCELDFHNDPISPGSKSNNTRKPMFDKILEDLIPLMEKITGKELYSTFSYYRVYDRDSTLKKHKDRQACEYVCSLNIGYEGKEIWPLLIKDSFERTNSISLKVGEGLIYKGLDLEHWREKNTYCDKAVNLLLMYVDKNGTQAWTKKLEVGLWDSYEEERE